MTKPDTHPPVTLDMAIAALMLRVGERVRAARTRAGMSRRVLSEVSGVSPRYLAQLEAGEGNISIALMLRVAEALGVAVETLVAMGDLSPEARRIAEAFDSADQPMQERVRAVLAAEPCKAGRLCLIGLRGAGKSTLGMAVAQRLGVPFIELNRAIEAAGGMPIAEIIALYGPDGYRQLEADALDKIVVEQSRAVIAVAGGIVGEAGTFDRLLDRFHTVWIKARPEDHMARVRAQGDTRPMAGNPQAMSQLRLILKGREAEYARADAVLDTSDQTVTASTKALLSLIERHGFIPKEIP